VAVLLLAEVSLFWPCLSPFKKDKQGPLVIKRCVANRADLSSNLLFDGSLRRHKGLIGRVIS
jgi:hypothetical protein